MPAVHGGTNDDEMQQEAGIGHMPPALEEPASEKAVAFSPDVVGQLCRSQTYTYCTDLLVAYLLQCVEKYAGECVLPAGVPLVTLHAELLLSAHRPYVLHDREAARGHYRAFLEPLRSSVAPTRAWLIKRFDELHDTVAGVRPVRADLSRVVEDAITEITDYMYLYFPVLRPKVEPARCKELSPLWSLAEKVERSGKSKGFRCFFSCHTVYWCDHIGKLKNHLKHVCKAVLPCTIRRLELIDQQPIRE